MKQQPVSMADATPVKKRTPAPKVGQRFGRLVITKEADRPQGKPKLRYVECQCDCGSEPLIRASHKLKSGHTKSCGCLRTDTAKENGSKQVLKPIDTSQRFGRLTILREITPPTHLKVAVRYVECQCDCGNGPVGVSLGNLKTGHIKSCGCLRNDTLKVTRAKKVKRVVKEGTRFGRLVVIQEIERPAHLKEGHARYVECQCDCGSRPTSHSLSALKNDGVQSCGCLQRESRWEHGHTASGTVTTVYRTWRTMRKSGCNVIPAWFSFSYFLKWSLDSGYKSGMWLCRRDREDGYNEDNAYWATGEEYRRIIRSKVWDITDPLLTVYKNVVNLNRFCREHNLSSSSMYAVSAGTMPDHKGWTATFVSDDAFEFEQDPESMGPDE